MSPRSSIARKLILATGLTMGVLLIAAAEGVAMQAGGSSGVALTLLAGCAGLGESVGYYWQSVRGHVLLMQPRGRWATGWPTNRPAPRSRPGWHWRSASATMR